MDDKIGPMAVLVAAGQVMAVDRYEEKMKKMTKSTLAMDGKIGPMAVLVAAGQVMAVD